MKYLIRGAIDPFENMNQAKFIIENHCGSNIGNLLFLNSVSNSLKYDSSVEIEYFDFGKKKADEEFVQKVNSECDAFIIPLANAFRVSFIKELKRLTAFIKNLTIPCHIIGVGIQQTITDDDFYDYFPYKKEVQNFVSTVLEHSSCIGVRGQYTADFLKRLGFREEVDYTIIGCPSMYTFGMNIPPLKKINSINESSRLLFNCKERNTNPDIINPFLRFLDKSLMDFPNYAYVMQHIDDIRTIYLDCYDKRTCYNGIDINKAVSFTNVHSWLSWTGRYGDFSFGNRIHGNIASVLSGVPSLVVPCDKRVKELADYHNIPQIDPRELNNYDSLADLFEKTSFNSVYSGHVQRFQHYMDFLHSLGLKTAYDQEYYSGETWYEHATAKKSFSGVVKNYSVCPDSTRINRYKKAFLYLRKRIMAKNGYQFN